MSFGSWYVLVWVSLEIFIYFYFCNSLGKICFEFSNVQVSELRRFEGKKYSNFIDININMNLADVVRTYNHLKSRGKF